MLTLLSSGSNAHGQLANGSFEDAGIFRYCSFAGQQRGSLPSGTSRVINVATGANHTLVLLGYADGRRELWGCGDGRKGQLRRGYQTTSTSFVKIQLSLDDAGFDDYMIKFVEATWETSFVVLSSEGLSDVMISFGSDDYGDLGIGIGGAVKDPARDFHVVSFDHLLPAGNTQIITISTGQRHVIVQLRSASSTFLVGWGLSRHGQLGSPADKSFASIPRLISSEANDTWPDTPLSCALGIHHTIVHRDLHSIVGLGSDRKGQLQVVKRFAGRHESVQSIHCTWNGSYVVAADHRKWEIWSSGSNSRNQLGWIPNDDDVVGIVKFPVVVNPRKSSVLVACGSEHVLALITPSDRISEVWGWGWNEHGNLGLDHTEDVPLPVRIWPRTDNAGVLNVCSIWAGSGTSWICAEIEEDISAH